MKVMTDDAEIQDLVERTRAGDRPAFAALEARYRDEVLKAIERRLDGPARSANSPEELANEVWLQAWRSLERFEWQGEASFLRWLHGIARHVEQAAARRTRVVLSLEEGVRDPSTDAPSPSQGVRRAERLERLQRAIDRLPKHYRKVVRLSRIEGLNSGQVAKRLDKSPEAIRHILVRALRLLRDAMGDTRSLSLPAEGELNFQETEKNDDD